MEKDFIFEQTTRKTIELKMNCADYVRPYHSLDEYPLRK